MGLDLPHVVYVREVGEVDGRPYIITDLVEGRDLGKLIAEGGQLRPSSAIALLAQLTGALKEVWRHVGLAHGDLRPGHLLLQRGELYVTGFGLSPMWKTAHGREVMGDPAYLAPEVAAGARPDPRSDFYALGCTFFELLTGRKPFGTAGGDALLACHAHERFPSVRETVPRAPAALDELLMRLAAKTPAGRPANYDEILGVVGELAAAATAAAHAAPVLIVEAGRQRGVSVEIPEGRFLLGRDPEQGFLIDDGRVSRHHARLTRTGSEVRLDDLGSRNGVKVNGMRTQGGFLESGDRILIGDTTLRIEGCSSGGWDIPLSGGVKDLPSSPVRGAFGARERTHARDQQLTVLAVQNTSDSPLQRVLAGLLSSRLDAVSASAWRKSVLDVIQGATAADSVLFVEVEGGSPRLSASSSDEAQDLSCVLPALERALPGQLSLSTSVQVGRDDMWRVVACPVLDEERRATAYLTLIRKRGGFAEEALSALEVACNALARSAARARSDRADTEVSS